MRQIYEVKEFPIKEKKEDSPKGLEGSEEWEDGTEEMYDENYRKYLQEVNKFKKGEDTTPPFDPKGQGKPKGKKGKKKKSKGSQQGNKHF